MVPGVADRMANGGMNEGNVTGSHYMHNSCDYHYHSMCVAEVTTMQPPKASATTCRSLSVLRCSTAARRGRKECPIFALTQGDMTWRYGLFYGGEAARPWNPQTY